MKYTKLILHIIALLISGGLAYLVVSNIVGNIKPEIPNEIKYGVIFSVGAMLFWFVWAPLAIGMGISPMLRSPDKKGYFHWDFEYESAAKETNSNNQSQRKLFLTVLSENGKPISLIAVIMITVGGTIGNTLMGGSFFQSALITLFAALCLVFWVIVFVLIGWGIMYLINRKDHRLPL